MGKQDLDWYLIGDYALLGVLTPLLLPMVMLVFVGSLWYRVLPKDES